MDEKVALPETFGGWLFLIAQVTIISVTLLGTFWLVLAGRSAGPFAAVGVGVLLLLRFGNIANLSLKGFGLEAAVTRANRAAEDAGTATEQANIATENLKVLGRNLAHAVLDLQVLQGRKDAVITFIQRVKFRDAIEDNLVGLGLTADQIGTMFDNFDYLMTFDLLDRARSFAPEGAGKDELKRELDDLRGGPLPSIEVVRGLFSKHNCLTPDADMLLGEAARYMQYKKVDPARIK